MEVRPSFFTPVLEHEDLPVLEFTEEDIPNAFICCISQEIMQRPAISPCGHSSDRVFLKKWIKKNQANCPKCRNPVQWNQVVDNFDLKNAIEEWGEKEKKFLNIITGKEKISKEQKKQIALMKAHNFQLLYELEAKKLREDLKKGKEKEREILAERPMLTYEQAISSLKDIFPRFLQSGPQERLALVNRLEYEIHFILPSQLVKFFDENLQNSELPLHQLSTAMQEMYDYLNPECRDKLDMALINLAQVILNRGNAERQKEVRKRLKQYKREAQGAKDDLDEVKNQFEELKIASNNEMDNLKKTQAAEIKRLHELFINGALLIAGSSLTAGASIGSLVTYIVMANKLI